MSSRDGISVGLGENEDSLDDNQDQEISEDLFNLRPVERPKSVTPANYHDPDVLFQSIEISSEGAMGSPDREMGDAFADDSEDDCVILSVRSIRPEPSHTKVRIKTEPGTASSLHAEMDNNSGPRKPPGLSGDEDLTPEQMMALQRAKISLISARSNVPTATSSTPKHRKRKARAESSAHFGGDADVESAMHADDDEDDQQWMHQQSSTEDEDEEYTNAKLQLNALLKERASRGGKLRNYDEFDNQTPDAAFARMLDEELNGTGLIDGEAPKKLKKARRKVGRTAREVLEIEKEQEKEKARSKSQKKKGRPPMASGEKSKKIVKKAKEKTAARKGKGKEKGKGKGKAGGIKIDKAVNEMRFMHRRDGEDNLGQRILEDLLASDPISERLTNPIFRLGPEPEIDESGSKATQLQRLYANIPDGSSKSKGRSDKAKLLQASRSFGFANVKAVKGKWLVKGMRSTLYHHQLLGAQWMVQRELSSEPPHGGLLADSMGLGKTVQTLACMVGNPPTEEDRRRGITATLIVVPSSVLYQWKEEIELHCSALPNVMIYKESFPISDNVLRIMDVVLTTYTEVMKQFPFPDRAAREKIAHSGYKSWWDGAVKDLGVLHRINWRRVVLDEAHAIKNNTARTSLACQHLRSMYRWCLTGTPLLNRLEELFPYLRFLKANYSMDYKTFERYFCDPDAEECNNRISTLLSYAMMRRTMKTTILNRPILQLPDPHPILQQVDFSKEEKIIYRITENRFRATLNNFLANGTAQRAYGVFFVQLLRLRQCTSHPFMLERTIKESWTSEDVDQLNRQLSRVSASAKPFYEQCKVWVAQSEEERRIARENGQEDTDTTKPFGISEFGSKFQFDKALDTLNHEELYSRITCNICSDVPTSPLITSCSHVFCSDCLLNHLHDQVQEADVDDSFNVCPHCDCIFSTTEPYRELDMPDDDNMDGGSDVTRPSKRHKSSHGGFSKQERSLSKGVDELGFEPFTKDSTWVTRSDHDRDFPLVPSAKTAALKALLLKGFEEAPLDKVVIYVQFRTLARIIGRMCNGEGWGFVYLTGDASLEHRTKAINKFKNSDTVNILIAGLKCGGLGLNFPFANRCISLDLWWNHAVEQQAFGRIFRMGQKKETYMTRLVVRNSIDMRLLGMQEWKLKACEKAIDENGEDGKGSKFKGEGCTLNLPQLSRLFGFLKTDEDDNLVEIVPDYDDMEVGGDASDNGEGGSSVGGAYGEGYADALGGRGEEDGLSD
ncbi:dna repair rad5 protein [Rutstroemia sp. NJR-2017a WRK4]|nr:dna repair rad5 protein [Rutstroemia sp. NJR-2017a WRK4]